MYWFVFRVCSLWNVGLNSDTLSALVELLMAVHCRSVSRPWVWSEGVTWVWSVGVISGCDWGVINEWRMCISKTEWSDGLLLNVQVFFLNGFAFLLQGITDWWHSSFFPPATQWSVGWESKVWAWYFLSLVSKGVMRLKSGEGLEVGVVSPCFVGGKGSNWIVQVWC